MPLPRNTSIPDGREMEGKRPYPPTGIRVCGQKRKNYPKAFQAARKVVKKIHDDPRAAQFIKPVDESDADGYYTIIQDPMDLGSILTYIEYNRYDTVEEIRQDVAKVWNNCRIFNSKSPWGYLGKMVVIWADLLEQEFEEEWEKEMVFPKATHNQMEKWLKERKQLQLYAHRLAPSHVHYFLCLAAAGSPDSCRARKFGTCAHRCELDLLKMNNATVRACIKFIEKARKEDSAPQLVSPVLAWPRDRAEDLTYDDEQYS